MAPDGDGDGADDWVGCCDGADDWVGGGEGVGDCAGPHDGAPGARPERAGWAPDEGGAGVGCATARRRGDVPGAPSAEVADRPVAGGDAGTAGDAGGLLLTSLRVGPGWATARCTGVSAPGGGVDRLARVAPPTAGVAPGGGTARCTGLPGASGAEVRPPPTGPAVAVPEPGAGAGPFTACRGGAPGAVAGVVVGAGPVRALARWTGAPLGELSPGGAAVGAGAVCRAVVVGAGPGRGVARGTGEPAAVPASPVAAVGPVRRAGAGGVEAGAVRRPTGR
ncbi:hypothetical protein [Streptomyces sp. NPDC016675]|uniref:hypothetical protein n=1 Tax=Streptomyces sp. NPDC016675 TaxID=3364970 RepID=UPI0036FE7F3C